MDMHHLLRPHQRQALAYASRTSRVALFMQMRLGKTLVAIRRALATPGPTLVVCPLSTMHSWKMELDREGIPYQLLVGSMRQKLHALHVTPDSIQWFIINPEGVRACPDILMKPYWQWVIVDESTCIRNPRAKVTKTFRKCDAPGRMILSGMPAPEGPEDFFEQMAFLHGEFMGCRTFWEWRVENMVQGFYDWEVPLRKRAEIARVVAEQSFMLSAEDAGIDLPRVYETRTVKLPTNVRRIYRQVVKEYRLGETETKWPLVVQTWLSMLASGVVPTPYSDASTYVSHHKVDELLSLMEGELRDSRLVIFCRFTREIGMLKRAVKNCAFMTGKTPPAERGRILSRFQSGKVRHIVLQEQGVGEKGLDLSAADVLVFMSNSWSCEVRSQCEARADYVGRKSPVLVLDIVAERTVDEAVVEALQEKSLNRRSLEGRIRRLCLREGLL